jgi:SsrA-binding protein
VSSRETGRGKLIAQNKKARHDYEILETHEAGLVLTGTEVKSLRGGKANLSDSYALPKGSEIFLVNANIAKYEPASQFSHEPTRSRKLLLHRREIEKIGAKIREGGYSLIPLQLYFKGGRAKVELGLGKGKKNIDKRDAIAAREAKREMARARNKKRGP